MIRDNNDDLIAKPDSIPNLANDEDRHDFSDIPYFCAMDIIYRIEDIQEVAKRVVEAASSRTVCLYGPMGAGKTTLVKAMVQVLGARDMGHSPTFGIVNEYRGDQERPLAYHFDFYRLNNPTEALDLGFEEYQDGETWVFIEWPEKLGPFLPPDTFDIHIEAIDATTRKISFHP